MSFEIINEKIRDDHNKCFDTILNGAQKIIDFMNRNKTPQNVAYLENSIPKIEDLSPAIPMIKGIMKMTQNFTAPLPPQKLVKSLDPKANIVNFDIIAVSLKLSNTLDAITEVRKLVNAEVENEDVRYKIELKLYELQNSLSSFLKENNNCID